MEAIFKAALPAEIVAVISNEPAAGGLATAQAHGISTVVVDHRRFGDRDAFDGALSAAIDACRPDYIVLAGFMRILTDGFVRAFEGRLLNIHPSLLPRHKGLHTHDAVLRDGDAEHGATVHFVSPQLDGGPPVIQGKFTVGAHDDAARLAERVMTEVERKIYPQAVAWMARGELRFEQGGAAFRGRPLREPLSLDDLEPGFR